MSEGGVGVEGREAPTHGQPRRAGREELPLSQVATDASLPQPGLHLYPKPLLPWPLSTPSLAFVRPSSCPCWLLTHICWPYPQPQPCPNYAPIPRFTSTKTYPPYSFSDSPRYQLNPFHLFPLTLSPYSTAFIYPIPQPSAFMLCPSVSLRHLPNLKFDPSLNLPLSSSPWPTSHESHV